MLRCWLAAVGAALSLYASAQDTIPFRRLAVTWKPLGLIDPLAANLTAGINGRIAPRWSIDADAGVIRSWNRTLLAEERFAVSRDGFKTSAALNFGRNGIFVSLHGFYNGYILKSSEYAWRYGRAYQQALSVRRRVNVYGAHAMAGVILAESKSRRVYYETYFGYGIRYKSVAAEGLPDDAEAIARGGPNSPLIGPDNEWMPSVAAGVRIGFRLK